MARLKSSEAQENGKFTAARKLMSGQAFREIMKVSVETAAVCFLFWCKCVFGAEIEHETGKRSGFICLYLKTTAYRNFKLLCAVVVFRAIRSVPNTLYMVRRFRGCCFRDTYLGLGSPYVLVLPSSHKFYAGALHINRCIKTNTLQH